MRKTLLALIIAAFVFGCGQKGPLYHPDDKPPAKKRAEPAQQSNTDADQKRQGQ